MAPAVFEMYCITGEVYKITDKLIKDQRVNSVANTYIGYVLVLTRPI